MKRIIFCLLLPILTVCAVVSAKAVSDVDVYINGRYLKSENGAYIENGRTMVPARSIFESLGASVTWNPVSRSVVAKASGTEVRLWIDNRTMLVNGKPEFMDTAPVIVNDLTFVPARAVSQALSAKVTWIPGLYAVNITFGSTKTLDSYPTVLVPGLEGFEYDRVSYDNSSVCFSVNVPDADEALIPESLIGLVNEYERSMTDIGWQKSAVIDTAALFETEFTSNTVSHCPYKSTFFINKTEDGRYLVFVSATDLITVYNTDSGEVRSITEADFITSDEYSASSWKRSCGERVTLYGTDNSAVQVFDHEAHTLYLRGYTQEEKTVVMYSPEGTATDVKLWDIPQFQSSGYTFRTFVTMYSPVGTTDEVGGGMVLQRIAEGWSVSPFYVLLYSADGRAVTVESHAAQTYLADGYKTEPYVVMYRMSDKIYVPESKIAIYEQAGWSKEPEFTEEKDKGAVTITDRSTVYITPNGKKYHISKKCAGTGAVEKMLGEVKSIYDPCKTCTDNKAE